MTPEESKKMMALLQTVWPNVTWTELSETIYVDAVDDTPYPVVEAAIREMYKTEQWPSCATLRNIIGLNQPSFGSHLEAFQKVKREISRVGLPGKPSFPDNPEIAKAVDLIGWDQICGYDLEKESFMVDRFKHAYEESCRIIEQDRKRKRNEEIGGGGDGTPQLPV